MSSGELLNTIMLLCTLSEGQLLHPVHGSGSGLCPDERATDLQREDKGLFSRAKPEISKEASGNLDAEESRLR